MCQQVIGFSYHLIANSDNVTYVDMGIHPKSNDIYTIRTDHGFDLPIQVSSGNGGPTLTCMDPLVSIYNIISCNLEF